jgi:hypothetical protein
MKRTAVADRSRFGLGLTLQYIENIALLPIVRGLASKVLVFTVFRAFKNISIERFLVVAITRFLNRIG